MKRNSPFNMQRSPRKDRLGYDQIFENEDELEQVPMSTKKTEFLEKEVLPDDTLQSIALDFNVNIAELKRVNNIHKDNEIYARKIIKIPHKPFSLLLESKFFRDKNDNKEQAREPSTSTSHHDEAKELVDIVNSSKAVPLVSNQSTPDTEEMEDNETDELLKVRPVSPEMVAINCKCADSDISPRFLILVVVLIGLGGPAAYVWYFWTRVESDIH